LAVIVTLKFFSPNWSYSRARNIKRQQPLMTSNKNELRVVGDVQYVFSRPGRRALKGLLDRKTNLSCHPRSANTAQEDTWRKFPASHGKLLKLTHGVADRASVQSRGTKGSIYLKTWSQQFFWLQLHYGRTNFERWPSGPVWVPSATVALRCYN